MLLRITPIILLLAMVSISYAQIPLRHTFENVKGNVVEMEVKSYQNLTLNDEGNPVFPKEHTEREVVTYENQRPIRCEKFIVHNDVERILSDTEYSYGDDGTIHHVIEYRNLYKQEKDSLILFRAFYPEYENGVLIAEAAINRFRELKERYEYTYIPNEDGFPTTIIHQYDFRKEVRTKKEKYYELQYDLEARLISKMDITPSDTLFMYQRTAVYTGEELYVGFDHTPQGKTHIATHKAISKDMNGNTMFEITEQNITTFNRFSRDGKIFMYKYGKKPKPTTEVGLINNE